MITMNDAYYHIYITYNNKQMTRPSVILETDTDRHQSNQRTHLNTQFLFFSLSYVSRFPGKKDVSFIFHTE